MTASPDTPTRPDIDLGPCGPDCVYIEGACRCYHGEAASAVPAWLRHVEPVF